MPPCHATMEGRALMGLTGTCAPVPKDFQVQTVGSISTSAPRPPVQKAPPASIKSVLTSVYALLANEDLTVKVKV